VPFRGVVGHRRLVSLLSRAIARGTLPQSLLLAGPAGVGKRRVAKAVAESVNCLQPLATPDLERDACGECASCRRIDRGVHPDVIVLEPDSMGSIKIDAVRDVIDRAGYRPFEGRRRVVTIDEADALTEDAQSALLKTLEEPPSASVFLLVSSVPDALLPTVRSRCPKVRFGALLPSDVADVLIRDHGYAEAEARAAAADADGSIARALAAESADLADAREVARRLLEQAARVSDPARRIDAARDLAPKKGTAVEERQYAGACLRALASLLRDIGLLGMQADRRMVANTDLEPQLEGLSRTFDADRSLKAYAAVDQALTAIERNVSPKVVADWIVLQL
jgi:DNA polymerase-3 subunit delta'